MTVKWWVFWPKAKDCRWIIVCLYNGTWLVGGTLDMSMNKTESNRLNTKLCLKLPNRHLTKPQSSQVLFHRSLCACRLLCVCKLCSSIHCHHWIWHKSVLHCATQHSGMNELTTDCTWGLKNFAYHRVTQIPYRFSSQKMVRPWEEVAKLFSRKHLQCLHIDIGSCVTNKRQKVQNISWIRLINRWGSLMPQWLSFNIILVCGRFY